MNVLDKKILDFIKKSGRRIKLNFLISKMLMGIQASLVLTSIILIIALLIPFESCYKLICVIITISLIVSIIFGIIKAPKKNEIALIADSKGLNERVITALEFIGDESEIAVAQKEDTLRNIDSYNFKKNIPIRIEKKEIYRIIILLILCFITNVIPTDAKKEAGNLRDFNKMKSEVLKKIDKEEKKIDREEELTKEEKEELKKILEEAKKELKETNKKEDTNKLINILDKKFDLVKEKADSEKKKQLIDELKKNLIEKQKSEEAREAIKNLNEINKGLSKSKIGKELLETLKTGDRETLEKKLQELNNSLENLSDKEKSEFSNALKDAATNLSDKELKALLEKTSDNVLDGEIDASELSGALTSLKSESNSGDTNNSDGKKSESPGSSGEGNSNGSGSKSGSGTGGNGNDGGGSGNGSGIGWNTGSKNGKENNSKPSNGEQVFIPGRSLGDDINLSGNKNNSGNSQGIESKNGLNVNGEKKDYNSIVGDYSKEEIDSMNNSSLPENLQDIVKDYFSNIE